MKDKVKISLAIPVYNGGNNLKKNLKFFSQSCDKKKFKNFIELIISDNGSKDNTQKIINKYKKKFAKKNNIRIIYFRREKNIGYYYNFLKLIKLITGEYTLFLCDDDFPQKKFYDEIFNLFKSNNYEELCFLPVASIKDFKSKIFGLNKFGHVLTRGASLSGVILKTKKISTKYLEKTLYPHNTVFLNYYLENGMRNLDLKSKIVIKDNMKFTDKFGHKGDRMNRKYDFAVLDKIKIVEKLYRLKKINYFLLYITIFKIYTWCFNVKWEINKEKDYETEELFFKEIQTYKRKFVLNTCIFLIIFRNLFLKKKKFYFNSLKEFLF